MKKAQKKKSIRGEDRISDLPDSVLQDILSLLPTTKEAIRTGTLSKRWKRVWTLLPNLIFINNYIKFDDFSSFVNTTLTLCGPLELNQFKVETNYDYDFESVFKEWVHYAVEHKVRKLHLLLETEYLGYLYEFELDKSFYINSCFTHLNLKGCLFDPSGPISWQNLTSLCITYGKLDEDLIENMLSGSPLLETLELSYCHGFSLIDITSKSVKNLVFSGYSNHESDDDDNEEFEEDIIQINAPYISYLAIQKRFVLSKLVLLSVSSLVKANLNYKIESYSPTWTQEDAEEVSKGLVLSLRHVEDLTVGDLCKEVFSSLKSKGFTFPPNLGS